MFYLYILMLTLFGLNIQASKESEAINRIKTKYNLHSAEDCRTGIRKKDFESRSLSSSAEFSSGSCSGSSCESSSESLDVDDIQNSDFQEAACMALGYKKVTFVDDMDDFLKDLNKDKDVKYLMGHKDLHFAKIINTSEESDPQYILYSPEGRGDAFRLIKRLLETEKEFSTHSDSMANEYLIGSTLGYGEENILFYFQRLEFPGSINKTSWDQFNEFVKKDWIKSGKRDEYAKAKREIDNWVSENQDLQKLEVSLKKNNNPNIKVLSLDQPFKQLLSQYDKKKKKHTEKKKK